VATLHVRNIPDDIYSQLQVLAQTRNRSLSAEVILLLQEALTREQARQKQVKLLADIRRRRFTYPPNKRVPDTVTLLREDRAR
jgi:plasmid stability protein